ncbi:MAG: hypothetical protein M1815_006123 [Lichina confinis]|nr:MAG: hypothetical protein M1815_006123 [Lichina confinis]
MATHRAHLYEGPNRPLKVTEMKTPRPTTGQVLVEVLATPIMHYTAKVLGEGGYLADAPLPTVPGAGAVARVVEVGTPNSSSLKPEQLVFCNPFIVARDDVSGDNSIIQGWYAGVEPTARRMFQGEFGHGAWAEKMIVPVENAAVLDEEILIVRHGYSVSKLTWINHLLVPYGGLESAGVKAGETVIVAPATGVYGGCAVLVALAMGARRVLALGRNEQALSRLEGRNKIGRIFPIKLTGDEALDTENIVNLTPNGRGADVYIDFAPPQAKGSTHFSACLRSLKTGGRAIFNGSLEHDVSINYDLLILKSLTIKGQFMFTPKHVVELVTLVEGRLLELDQLQVQQFSFDQIEQALQTAKSFDRLGSLAVLNPVLEP